MFDLRPTTSGSITPTLATRPLTRAECVNGPRPCPWVTCEYHLLVTLRPSGQPQLHGQRRALPSSAAEVVVRAWVEEAAMLLDQLEHTCELDVTAGGLQIGPRRIAQLLGLTKQRVDQVIAEHTPTVRRAITAAMGDNL